MGSIVRSELITFVITHILFIVRAEIGIFFVQKKVMKHVYFEFVFFQLPAILKTWITKDKVIKDKKENKLL